MLERYLRQNIIHHGAKIILVYLRLPKQALASNPEQDSINNTITDILRGTLTPVLQLGFAVQ